MPAGDLLTFVTEPVRRHVERVLGPGLPASVVAGVSALVDVTALVALGVLLAAAGRAVATGQDGQARERGGWLAGAALPAGGAVVAAGLLVWIVWHPSAQFHEVFARGDHLAFALLAGLALARTPLRWRSWLVTVLSLGFLCQYIGPLAVAVAVTAGLLGFAAVQSPSGRKPWAAILVHAAIGLGVYGLCWQMRAHDFLGAVYIFGLFAFLFLRQISFAVAACQGRAGDIGSYLCYLVFYPGVTGVFGGPEVWSEFSRRNLSGRTSPDHTWGARGVARGMLEIWAADRIPMSAEAVFASATTVATWTNSLVLFVKVALTGMGFWALIDATASFYGFRLRPNFEGILRSRNPSELWRSWRGALTNWLVCHVYAPLGANRRHQSLNILAAFGVSMVWHWAGVPFLTPDFHLRHLAPTTAWAAANAIAVVGHVQMIRRRWTLLPGATPSVLREGMHLFFTYCLGTLSVTLPSAQLGAQDQFVPLLRRLAGLG